MSLGEKSRGDNRPGAAHEREEWTAVSCGCRIAVPEDHESLLRAGGEPSRRSDAGKTIRQKLASCSRSLPDNVGHPPRRSLRDNQGEGLARGCGCTV